MATSGNYGTSNQYIVYWIEYWLNSQNINNNSSNITVKVWVKRTNTGYQTYGSGNVSLNINGTTYNQAITSSESITNTPRCLIEKTVDIPHDSDGRKTVRLEASISHSQFSSSLNGLNWELSTIKRASKVTCAGGDIGSKTKINISRESSSFTHTLTYEFLGLTGTIVTKTSNINIDWTIPTTFYSKLPNSDSGEGTIYCETFSGNISIGKNECKFKANVSDSIPEGSATVTDTNTATINLTGNSNKLVRYYSNARVVTKAEAKNGAQISEIKVVNNEQTKIGSDVTLNGVTGGYFTIYLTDSRKKMHAFLVSKTVADNTFVPYIRLAFTKVNIKRLSSTSNTINAEIKGNYFEGNFGKVANSLSLKWRYRERNGSWGSYNSVIATISSKDNSFSYSGTLGVNFDFKKEYEFEFQAVDKLATISSNQLITRGLPIIDIGKNDVKVNGKVYADKLSNIVMGNYQYNEAIPSKTPTSIKIPLNKAIEENNYQISVNARGNGNYGNWITALYGLISNKNELIVNLFNHGDGPSTGTIFIDYVIIKMN